MTDTKHLTQLLIDDLTPLEHTNPLISPLLNDFDLLETIVKLLKPHPYEALIAHLARSLEAFDGAAWNTVTQSIQTQPDAFAVIRAVSDGLRAVADDLTRGPDR